MIPKYKVGDIIKQKRGTISKVLDVVIEKGVVYYLVGTVQGVGPYGGREICLEDELHHLVQTKSNL